MAADKTTLTEWETLNERRGVIISLLRSLTTQLKSVDQPPISQSEEAEGLTASALDSLARLCQDKGIYRAQLFAATSDAMLDRWNSTLCFNERDELAMKAARTTLKTRFAPSSTFCALGAADTCFLYHVLHIVTWTQMVHFRLKWYPVHEVVGGTLSEHDFPTRSVRVDDATLI